MLLYYLIGLFNLKWLNRLEFNDWLPPALAFAVRKRGQPGMMKEFFSDLERLAYSLLITKAGIMGDDEAQCQSLLNRITVETDMTLDMLSYQKGAKVPGRKIQNLSYNRVFDETARRIYEAVTGRVCPESVKVL